MNCVDGEEEEGDEREKDEREKDERERWIWWELEMEGKGERKR